ncbi:MAG: helix-turn-helix domain-containing protein [Patescibacteria group bacterium]
MLSKHVGKILKNLGMSDKEAQIYIACLSLGSSVVAKISKRAQINRITCYDILEKLVQKGYVNFLNKKNIRYFSATDPEIIGREALRHANEFKEILPDLHRLKSGNVHPHIQYFEGVEGIKAIYSDTLTSKTEILNYANSQEIRSFWPEYDKEYVEKRAKKKIYLRGIAPSDEWGQHVQEESRKYFREIRLIPKEKYNFTNEINIYENKIAICSFGNELIGMIIESSEIANTQRAIFLMAWEFAKKQ